jgi:hypothetical protein
VEPFLPDGCGWQHRVTQLDASSRIRSLLKIHHRQTSKNSTARCGRGGPAGTLVATDTVSVNAD